MTSSLLFLQFSGLVCSLVRLFLVVLPVQVDIRFSKFQIFGISLMGLSQFLPHLVVVCLYLPISATTAFAEKQIVITTIKTDIAGYFT